jgi:hydroxypyruvate isomerase
MTRAGFDDRTWIFALNVSMVFTGLPFLGRFDAAATAGLAAVDF